MPEQNNQYDFIINPNQPAKKPGGIFGFLKSGSLVVRIAVVGIAAVLLIVGIVFVSSLLSASSNAQKDHLLKLVSAQAQLIDLAENAKADVTNPDTLVRLTIIKLSVKTDENKLVAYLAKNGLKVDKIYTTSKDSASLKTLETAKLNNKYDETLNKIFDAKLAAYRNSLSTQYKSTTGPKLREVLKNSYDSATTISAAPSS